MADVTPLPRVIQSLYADYRNNKLFVNRRYQRKLVWTLEEKQKLIDSILKKYPVPAILLSEKEGSGGTFEIIDGLQRLHAIMSFIETEYTTLDGRLFDVKHYATANSKASEGGFIANTSGNMLNETEIGAFLDYAVSVSIMRNATDAEVNDVFDRINTYGHRLSEQERRQSGVQNTFATMVREIACDLRGDVSSEILTLEEMPAISIDLPLMKHGYNIKAEDVFWVKHGVLRSTDLRDSLDEQCIADIAACIVGGSLIERSKSALDKVYDSNDSEYQRITDCLGVYGAEKFQEEFKYCVEEILKACNEKGFVKLRDLMYKTNTNPFQSAFAVLLMAIHELIIKEGNKIVDYSLLKTKMDKIGERISSGKSATSQDARRTNINGVKGYLSECFVKDEEPLKIYNNHGIINLENTIRRSQIELADYELKQGLVTLADNGRAIDKNIHETILETICGIANIGRGCVGKLIIGVTDKDADADRVRQLDSVDPILLGNRYVVGVNREARLLGISTEDYVRNLADVIRNSTLSEQIKSNILIDFNEYYGLGVVIITIPAQDEISFYNSKVFWRDSDNTKEADPRIIAQIAKRF